MTLEVYCGCQLRHVKRRRRTYSAQEPVLGLLRVEERDRGQHTECVAGEVDDVRGLRVGDARELGVVDELCKAEKVSVRWAKRDRTDRVGTSRVLGDAGVLVVGLSRSVVVRHVLKDRAEL